MYDRPTWSDFQYQEEHDGCLPDKGLTADDLYELFADADPNEIQEILRLERREPDD